MGILQIHQHPPTWSNRQDHHTRRWKPQRPVSSLDPHSDKFRRRMRRSFGRHPAANASMGEDQRHDGPRRGLVPGSRSYGSRSAVKVGLLFSDPGMFTEINCLLALLWRTTGYFVERSAQGDKGRQYQSYPQSLGPSLGGPHHRTRKCSGTIFKQSTVTTAMALHPTYVVIPIPWRDIGFCTLALRIALSVHGGFV